MTAPKWRIAAHFGDRAPRPKVPGEVAVLDCYDTDGGMASELRILTECEDIGRIVVTRL